MGKSEVYSWRVSAETKAALEHEARKQGVSLAGLLERISSQWLQRQRSESGADAAEQRRLHAKASKLFGSIAGGDPERSARSREIVRERLSRRHELSREINRLDSADTIPSPQQSRLSSPRRSRISSAVSSAGQSSARLKRGVKADRPVRRPTRRT